MSQRRNHLAVIVFAAVAGHAGAAENDSLFDADSYKPLVAEAKAFRTGDILTVIVQEVASATSAVDARADRKASVSGNLGSSKVNPISANAAAATDNEGGGRTQRSGRLAAQLSVRVIDVLPNGDLSIFGQQDIRVNDEAQTITLKGIVRTRDIAEGNTVLSGRIAAADIRFNGDGFATEKSKPGWLTRLLSLLGF